MAQKLHTNEYPTDVSDRDIKLAMLEQLQTIRRLAVVFTAVSVPLMIVALERLLGS